MKTITITISIQEELKKTITKNKNETYVSM